VPQSLQEGIPVVQISPIYNEQLDRRLDDAFYSGQATLKATIKLE